MSAKRVMGYGPSHTKRNQRRLLIKQIEAAIAAHPCGDCVACCTIKSIAEIEKPEGVTCKHVVETKDMHPPARGGCRIHDRRPTSCRDYFCAWKHGLVALDQTDTRPDKIGLMFELATNPPPEVSMLAVREVWPGAIDASMELLMKLLAAHNYVLYLIRGERRQFMGPEEKVYACQQWARRRLPVVLGG